VVPLVPAVTLTAVPTPKPVAPPKEENESTVAISLDALVAQIDSKPAEPKPPEPKPATGSFARPAVAPPTPSNQVAPAARPSVAEEENESTMAISLDALVAQIDSRPVEVKPVEVKPLVAPVDPKPVAEPDNESTMAISLDALVAQIDSKPAPAESKPAPVSEALPPVTPEVPAAAEPSVAPALVAPAAVAPAPVVPAAVAPARAPVEELPESESTMAISLDALVAQIDSQAPKLSAPSVSVPAPAAEENESTMAISLADLVDHIDAVSDIKINVAPAPEGRIDDLKRIRGVGPTTEKRLNGAGILTWAQMASLSDDDLNQVADLLKVTVDKIKREQWVEQARALRT
jgi:predicted flap endonuclease-1-like 5' DNA nuclease